MEMHIGAHKKYQEVLGEGFAEDGTLERPEVRERERERRSANGHQTLNSY
jgi:hypothetical protein